MEKSSRKPFWPQFWYSICWLIYFNQPLLSSSSSMSQSLPVSEGLIHIGCYFILVSLLTLLWLWESYLMLSNFLNLSYLLLHNKLPPHLVTKRTNINYLTVFAGQESDHSLAGFPMSAVARAVISSEGSTRGRFTSRFTLWLLEGFVSSQAVGMSISVPHWW